MALLFQYEKKQITDVKEGPTCFFPLRKLDSYNVQNSICFLCQKSQKTQLHIDRVIGWTNPSYRTWLCFGPPKKTCNYVQLTKITKNAINFKTGKTPYKRAGVIKSTHIGGNQTIQMYGHFEGFPLILLMEEILHHLGCMKPIVNNGKKTTILNLPLMFWVGFIFFDP